MDPEQRADLDEQVAAIEESTERRMHEAAERLHDPERVHRRADRLTEKALAHLRRARLLRRGGNDRNDSHPPQ